MGTAKWDNPGLVKTLAIWKELFSDGIMEPGSLGLQQYPDANFGSIKIVDPGLQLGAVQNLIKTVGNTTQPREALLSADLQNAILIAAQSVATGSASPQAAAHTLQSAAVASGEKFS